MLKLVYVIARRTDHTTAQFYDYWLNEHGPLVAAQAVNLRLRKYVQSHLIEHPAVEALRISSGMLPPVDGITEVWWDSLADMQAAYATQRGATSGRILAADEAKFIDFANSHVFLTVEHAVFDRGGDSGPEAVKAIHLLQRHSELSQSEFQRTWRDDHGPLAIRFAQALNMHRHVQSHTVENEVNAGFQASGGFAPPLDGITEIWFRSLREFEHAATHDEGRAAFARLAEDQRRFVDSSRARLFLTREHTIFDHT